MAADHGRRQYKLENKTAEISYKQKQNRYLGLMENPGKVHCIQNLNEERTRGMFCKEINNQSIELASSIDND